LEEFLSTVPKHKGTEKLLKYARRRLAELRREAQERREKQRAIRAGPRYYVEKDGDVQLAVVGPPSSGKSALIKCLTNAQLEPDDVPFSTVEPVPAMFIEDNVYVQLVKAPSLVVEDRSSELNSLVLALVRNADGVLLVFKSDEEIDVVSKVVEIFEEGGILLYKPNKSVRIERRGLGGLQIIGGGRIVGATLDDLRKLLYEYGIHHATVYISGEVSLEDVEESLYVDYVYKPAIAVFLKTGELNKELIEYLSSYSIPHFLLDLKCNIDRRGLLEAVLKSLSLIRVFTKQVHSRDYVEKPLVVKEGSTVGDIAKKIHSSFYENFKYAIVWRRESYPGRYKKVGLDYKLSDGDIVEIHA